MFSSNYYYNRWLIKNVLFRRGERQVRFGDDVTLNLFAGTLQQGEAAVQVLPSAAASQGPAADKRAQPLGPEERPDAADDDGRQPADSAGAGPRGRGEFAEPGARADPLLRKGCSTLREPCVSPGRASCEPVVTRDRGRYTIRDVAPR